MPVSSMAFAWWLVWFPAPMAAGAAGQALASQATPETSETPPEPTGERVKLKFVTPEIVRVAEDYLAEAMHAHAPVGAEEEATIAGRRYVLRVEWHYHPPGFVGAPSGWHKGITVYALR